MEENKKIRVAITHGDTNGIGYELIFKTFEEPGMLEICTPIIYGSPKVATYYRKMLDLKVQFSIIQQANEAQEGRINLLTAVEDDIKVDVGQPTEESGTAAIMALDRAISDYREGLFDVLVTAPVNNSNINIQNYQFPGQTKYIETCLGNSQNTMDILINDRLRLTFATPCIALKDVTKAISKDIIIARVSHFKEVIRRDFNISNPRIAVLSLNPYNPENGTFGPEEDQMILPAIQELADNGIQAFGPYPAAEFFGEGYFDEFDGILAMYHDQGIAPFKAIAPEYGVVLTTGLQLVRTASDQTVDFEYAGKNAENPSSFRHAIYTAIDAFRNRARYDEPYENPLKKLYHERHDEGEKVRFSIPKKHSGAPFTPNKESKRPENNGPKNINGSNNRSKDNKNQDNRPQQAQEANKPQVQQQNQPVVQQQNQQAPLQQSTQDTSKE